MKLKLSDYTIEFGPSQKILAEYLETSDYSSINVLVDENTKEFCLPIISNTFDEYNVITIPSGEENKTLATCEKIWGVLQNSRVDRHALLVNLGGGVIGDMGGFVASTYMRGIQFVQIPTTLLSQVDASVGGKLGVDFNGYKNFIGLFNNPKIVIIDSEFFKTLPTNELESGYAEMIKHALIRDEKSWKSYLTNSNWERNLSNSNLLKSVNIKREVVIEDPFEIGIRKILNFGHTLGHAIETYSFSTPKPLLHGYAIALGIVGEAYISHQLLGLGHEDLEAIKKYIQGIYKMDTGHLTDIISIMDHMRYDKKNRKNKILFSLLEGVGKCTFDVEASEELIRESLEYTLNV